MLFDSGLFGGPSSDHAAVRFDGAAGNQVQNSILDISDDGVLRSTTNSGANAVSVPLTNFLQLTSNYTLTATTSMQKLFGVGTLSLASGVYSFELFVHLTNTGVANLSAWTVDILGAGAATTDRWMMQLIGVDSTSALAAAAYSGSGSVSSAFPDPAIARGASNTSTGLFKAIGNFRVSSAGTIIPSIALNGAIAAIVQANSYFWIDKIAESAESSVGAWT